MKTLRLLLILAVAMVSSAAFADDVDGTFVFVDAAGNVLADGSEITVKGLTPESAYDDAYISSGLYTLNTTSGDAGVSMRVNITRLDNGQLDCCYPSICTSMTTVGEAETYKGQLPANETHTLATEWYPTAFGTCTAELQIMVYEAGLLNPGDFKAYGPTITVNFVYDETSAGIDGVSADANEVVGYYTLDGKALAAPQAGVTVVKYADGTSVKTIFK